jgi:putative ABC transport system substrate-binding protein
MMNKRRQFMILLAASSLRAQQANAQRAMPTIGFIGSVSEKTYTSIVDAFRLGLSEAGFVDGRGVTIEFRWADGHYDRLPALTTEIINRGVDVIFAASLPAAIAAKKATATIPIVFVMGADPVKLGIVNSLRQPGGNVTGVTQLFGMLGAKRLELLREIMPNVAVVGIISNPQNQNAKDHLRELDEAARAIGQKTVILSASNEAEIAAAFAALGRHDFGAALVGRRSVLQCEARSVRVARNAPWDTDGLLCERVRPGWRSHFVRPERQGELPPRSRLRWQDPERRKAS